MTSGEYSWVDPLGTRHTVVYRADEDGFKILETREEKGFVKVDTPDQIRLKKKSKDAAEVKKTKSVPTEKVQKVTFRVPKSIAGNRLVGSSSVPRLGTNLRARTPRRRKLIRVVKRPKTVATTVQDQQQLQQQQQEQQRTVLFQPLRFPQPATTPVVDIRTVPQRIDLPRPTSSVITGNSLASSTGSSSAAVVGGGSSVRTGAPVKLQKNLFFVPLKFPAAEEQTLAAQQQARETAVTGGASEVTVQESAAAATTVVQPQQQNAVAGTSTVVHLRRDQKHRNVNLPRARVLKKVPAPPAHAAVVKTPAETKQEQQLQEPSVVSVAKNRHIDPKSFRTTRLRPHSRPRVLVTPPAATPASVSVVTPRPIVQQQQLPQPAPILPTPTALPRRRIPHRRIPVQSSPAIQSPSAVQEPQQETLPASVTRLAPQSVVVPSAPAALPLPAAPNAAFQRPSIRFLPAEAPVAPALQEQQQQQQHQLLDVPHNPQPFIRFISLPVQHEADQQQQPEQNQPNVRLIPFATLNTPESVQLQQQQGQQFLHQEFPSAPIPFGPQLPPQPIFQRVSPLPSQEQQPSIAQQLPQPVSPLPLPTSVSPAPPTTLLRFRPSDAVALPAPQGQQGLGVQPQQQEQQQQQQQQQPTQIVSHDPLLAQNPFFVRVHPVSFSESPFLRVFHSGADAAAAPVRVPAHSFLPAAAAPQEVQQQALDSAAATIIPQGLPNLPLPNAAAAAAPLAIPLAAGGPSRVLFRSPGISYQY